MFTFIKSKKTKQKHKQINMQVFRYTFILRVLYNLLYLHFSEAKILCYYSSLITTVTVNCLTLHVYP